jgi:hypothetical protein
VFFAKPYVVDQVCATLARMAAEQSAGHFVAQRSCEPDNQPQAMCG